LVGAICEWRVILRAEADFLAKVGLTAFA